MGGGAVVALLVVLQHQLPVGLDRIDLAVGNLGARQAVGTQSRLDGAQRGLEVGRLGVRR